MFGRRVPKTHPRVEAYGAIDELSAALGLARSEETDTERNRRLASIQETLLSMGASLAVDEQDQARYGDSKIGKPATEDLDQLDAWVNELEVGGVTFDGFVMPGENRLSATLHLSRTTCRRAEREVVRLREQFPGVGDLVIQYLNRLSDLLWLFAREAETS